MTFTGIPVAALDFYEDLETDNSKLFWAGHKSIYEDSVRAPLQALATELAAEFGSAKLFRPYRDVRFAKDKTPYKTHQGAWFGETSLYLQISASGLFVAGGYWEMSGPQVQRLRRAVTDNVAGTALERTLVGVEGSRFEIGGKQLTRVPSGFDRDHPRADLLKRRALTASRDFGCPRWLATKRARSEIAKAWRSLEPLITWLDTHVGRD